MSQPHVSEGRPDFVSAAMAIAGGLVAAGVGVRPTGQRAIDIVLTASVCAAVAWCAGGAPWWLLVVAALCVAALASSPFFFAVGCAAALAGVLAWRTSARHGRWLRGLSAALLVVGLCGLQVGTHFGAATIAAVAIGSIVAVVGALRHPRRKRIGFVAAVAATVTVVAVALFGLSAANARTGLDEAADLARDGLQQLSHGDVDLAQTSFEQAATAFADAAHTLDRPWTQPARLVPVVAQHRTSAVDLANGAADASRTVAGVLAGFDLDSVRVADGHIDVAAVEALQAPLDTVEATIDDLQQLVDETDSPWLVAPLRDRLHELDAEIDEHRGDVDNALAAVRAAPAILGADGPRVYFIAFATPAEARGSLGFMGNWAELTVDDGRIEMTRFGRTRELNEGGEPDRRLTGMDEFLARYGGYGFSTGPDGTTADNVWQVITMSPHFPSVGEAISQLYPQSGGQEIDGVFALDPTALAALLEFTGPISAEGVPIALDSANAEEFLDVEQYIELQETVERVDALDAVAHATFQQLLDGGLPGPRELGDTFGPLVRAHHLAGWMVDPTEQDLAVQLGLDHALPELDASGTVAVAINNSGASKIDSYAAVAVDAKTAVDTAGQLSGTVAVTIVNKAPTELSPFVVGNTLGEPHGTNISYISVFVPYFPTEMTVDGQAVEPDVSSEQRWYVASTFMSIPAGEQRTFEVRFEGSGDLTPAVPPFVFGPDTRRTTVVAINGVEQP